MDNHAPRVAARWAVIDTARRLNWDIDATAAATQRTRFFVSHWIARYRRTNTVNDAPRSGRPTILSPAQASAGCTAVAEHQSVPAAAAHLKTQQVLDESVSPKTLYRAVCKQMDRKPVQQRPILTPRTKQLRLAFSKQKHDVSKLMAMDSTYFTLGTVQRGRKYWVMKGHQVVAGKPNKSQQLHVYAGISVHGKTSLIRVTGTTGHKQAYYSTKGKLAGVGAEEFQEVMRTKLAPQTKRIFAVARVNGWSFLMDNAPAHTAKATKDYIAANSISVVKGWPPNSPDLNPIENAWAWCKRRVYAKQYNTLDDLWQAVQAAWEALPDSVCRGLMTSLQQRKAECLKRDGGYAGY